jgi:hypothetical protein
MKQLSLLFIGFCFSLIAFSQKNSFSIKLNEKQLVKTKLIPETNPLKVSMLKSSLKQTNSISIKITESEPLKNWHRDFIFNDKDGIEQFRYTTKTTNGTFAFPLDLPKNFKKNILSILTIAVPDDANAAATMRLRTFPLVDISFK